MADLKSAIIPLVDGQCWTIIDAASSFLWLAAIQGNISKRGDGYLRSLFTTGSLAVTRYACRGLR
jgi:hypothetical protein